MTDTREVYPNAREQFLKGNIDWFGDEIKCSLINDYNYGPTHKNLNDFTGNILCTTTLLDKTLSTYAYNGTTIRLGAADAVFVQPESDQEPTALLIYSSSVLICYMEVSTRGFPIALDGSDVILQWLHSNDYIFLL